MLCQNCGKELQDGAGFCTECGAKVAEGEPVEIHTDMTEEIENKDALSESETPAGEAAPVGNGQSEKHKETLREKYVSFHGRLNRKRYFFRNLLLLPFEVLLFLLTEDFAFSVNFFQNYPITYNVVCILLTCIFLVLSTSFSVRRLHDLNLHGWLIVPIYVISMFFPIVHTGVECCLLFNKGTEGPNKYGPDPLAK